MPVVVPMIRPLRVVMGVPVVRVRVHALVFYVESRSTAGFQALFRCWMVDNTQA